jgi:seryl-tRNA synthetase
MIDVQLLRENPEKFKKATKDKQLSPSLVNKALELDKKWRDKLQAVEKLRKERNILSKKATAENIKKAKKIKQDLKKVESELKNLEVEYQEALKQIPNSAADDVKAGKDESENEVVKKWGKPKKLSFKPKDHLELGEKLGIIDVKRAAKVSGSRFGYLKGDAVRLEFALVNLALETLTKEGFIPVIPPVLIKKEAMEGMGYLEHGGEEDMYVFDKDGLVLVGTSEQSIGPMHADEMLDAKTLPRRYMGFSTCFRREAGSYGKDTRGLFRVHQFDKVEMFSFTKAEESDEEHEFLLSLEEKIFRSLEIPYQISKMVTGDLGLPASRKYDIDAWMPGQDKFREVTSTSNTTDFQARRLNIRYKDKGKTEYVHMLNGTATAIGRTIIAILENYQQKDGSVKVPKVLQKWVGKKVIK